MATTETVLVIHSDGDARKVAWPAGDEERRQAVRTALGSSEPRMARCGKGILGFYATGGGDQGSDENAYATAAFAEQGVEVGTTLFGPVLFARNPSKGSIVKPLTDAQAANLLLVTGARLMD